MLESAFYLLMNSLFLMLRIVPGDSFPKPLSREKESEYLQRWQEGDLQARNILVEHNMRLVTHIIKKYYQTEDVDDLISIGTIGLIKGINTYKPDKNVRLATYASRCIENEILMHLRKTSKLKSEVSLDEPLTVDGDGNELVLADILGVEENTVTGNLEKTTEKQLLFESIKKLNPKERQIMIMRFGLNNRQEKTQKEVADLLGISQSYISRIEKKIVGKLRKELLKTI